MPRNFATTQSPLGNLQLERNAKDGSRVGVTKAKNGKSRARVSINGKVHCLGTFDTSPEAAVAVAVAKATAGAGLASPGPYKKSGEPLKPSRTAITHCLC